MPDWLDQLAAAGLLNYDAAQYNWDMPAQPGESVTRARYAASSK
jgi:hypothetical protein